MTKIKLLSALALAVFAANAATVVVSADQTVGSIEFDNDTTTIVTPKDPEDPTKPLPPSVDLNDPIVITDGPSGGLFFSPPAPFNFGSHKVGATDIFSGKILDYDGEPRPNQPRKQGVIVYDGRIDKDDWTLSAKLSEFDTKKLAGTTITIENVTPRSEFTGQVPLLIQGPKTEITQTSSVDFLKSNPKSKGTTSAVWDNFSDVKIHVPAKEITKGTHKATVDWTLVAGAN